MCLFFTYTLRAAPSSIMAVNLDDKTWLQCILPVIVAGLGLSDPFQISEGAYIALTLTAFKFWSSYDLAGCYYY